ncbi:MAG: hypothetical protein WCC36_07660 [Gammaproteobacteria bacterium]
MILTTIILLVPALYIVQIFPQETPRLGFDLWGIVGNRDNQPELSVVAGRLDRAKNNMREAVPIFLALGLPARVKGGDTSEEAQCGMDFPHRAARLYGGLGEWCPRAAVGGVVGGSCQPRHDGAASDLERLVTHPA